MTKRKLKIAVMIGVISFILFLLKEINNGGTSFQNIIYFIIYGIAVTLLTLLVLLFHHVFIDGVGYARKVAKENQKNYEGNTDLHIVK